MFNSEVMASPSQAALDRCLEQDVCIGHRRYQSSASPQLLHFKIDPVVDGYISSSVAWVCEKRRSRSADAVAVPLTSMDDSDDQEDLSLLLSFVITCSVP